jgi:hypothetical protein
MTGDGSQMIINDGLEGEDAILSCPDIDTAKIKLAFLKEKSEFQKFFQEIKSSWDKFKNGETASLCQELRSDDEENENYADRIHIMDVKGTPFWGGRGQKFGLYDRFIPIAQRDGTIATDIILNLLNPDNKHLDNYSDAIEKVLPILFLSSSICEVGLNQGLNRSPDGKLEYRRYDYI